VLDSERQKLLDEGMIYDFIPRPEANKIIMMRNDLATYGFEDAELLFEAYKTRFATSLHAELSECIGQVSAPVIEDGLMFFPSRFLFEQLTCEGWKENKYGESVVLEKAVLKKL
jgi:hypothetical protein